VYLGDGQVLRHEPREAELVVTERRVRWLWDRIERTARSGEWTPRTSALCGWCSHQALCPAFGGTAPPVPDGAVELALGIVPDVAAQRSAEPDVAAEATEAAEATGHPVASAAGRGA
jgi:putative RecB family exonuclease